MSYYRSMSKTFLLWLLTLLLIANASSQNNFPPVYEIANDTTVLDTLKNTYWQILEDKSGKLSLKDVTQPPTADKFHYNLPGKIDRHVSIYWFRFLMKNNTGHDVSIGF